MKKLIYNILALVLVLNLVSCGISKKSIIVPKAVNTVNSVTLNELNLERKDYEILRNVSAESVIKCEFKQSQIRISDENEEFTLRYNVVNNQWTFAAYSGVLKLGYLSNDYAESVFDNGIIPVEDVARRTAIYRLINIVQQEGADGVIEPVVSTSVEQIGKRDIVLRAVVSAKLVRLKANK